MITIRFSDCLFEVDPEKKLISRFNVGSVSLLAEPSELFYLKLTDTSGASVIIPASSCEEFGVLADDSSLRIKCSRFSDFGSLTAELEIKKEDSNLECGVKIASPGKDRLVEWVEIMPLVLEPLALDGGTLGSEILIPYNEGALVDTLEMRDHARGIRYAPACYPSQGYYSVFPNMVCSQFLAYVFNVGSSRRSVYLGAHDPSRAPKEINFCRSEKAPGVMLEMKYFCGVGFGESYSSSFPLVVAAPVGDWQDAAGIYREWFYDNLPEGLRKIRDNPDLPEWYGDSPLVVAYPIRGVHDLDLMEPNALYPYTNALGLIDEISEKTGSRILVLLMHWEGTGPWCPPYVLPPYGDKEDFRKYLDALHERGQLLGVYCSGFGYTLKSNLVDYNNLEEFEKENLIDSMCAGPDGKVVLSPICTGQRSGYDSCPASPGARKVLDRAYIPLITDSLDYVQILDQNHGGGQYLCYSRDHGHPPAPGEWMTNNMRSLLSDWHGRADKTLLGCESAAAEPFMQYLSFSDNRFELCYKIGRPVPLYAYLYHEFVRNFMGNQCGCPLPPDTDSLRYRLAYSFAAGDSLTLTLFPDGRLLSRWSLKDFSVFPDREEVFAFIRMLRGFFTDCASEYLISAKMIKGLELSCPEAPFGHSLPAILTSAWETESSRVQILVNPFPERIPCVLGGKEISLEPLSAALVDPDKNLVLFSKRV